MKKLNDLNKEKAYEIDSKFHKIYKIYPDLIVSSPGRAEIIGNHTDYNQGFALSCAISRTLIAAFRKRKDKLVRIYSLNYPTKAPITFKIQENIRRSTKNDWADYAKGVVVHLLKNRYKIKGADILIDSDVPTSGGVSSSAAFELAMAYGLLSLCKRKIDPYKIALICQNAENQYVKSPCGFLDQGTISFAKRKKFVLMDFRSKGDLPVSSVKLIPSSLEKHDVVFVILVDKSVKRQLGKSGYPERRQMCEDSIPFWKETLDRKITSLRDVSVSDFRKYKSKLKLFNPTMARRVEHVVYENDRVLESVEALEKDQIDRFGKLLTQSGLSALKLYNLDDKTPELTFLYQFGKKQGGVVGIRNMGGGFSAIALALVKRCSLESFKQDMKRAYEKRFKGKIEFIEFEPEEGIKVN
ncbi:galactokinase [Candidatus Dojkabacteria bacterium]|nr:galactokinase [Candidatus Dojkabacteria bacterium]